MKNSSLRNYLLTGLVVWLPILATFGILRFIVDLLDQTIALLPKAYQPEQLLGIHIPGFGVALSLFLLVITGLVTTNIIGQKLVRLSELLLNKIPLVRSIYTASKQVSQAIFSSNGQSFRRVLLVEFPRKGMWSLGFQTGSISTDLQTGAGPEMVSVFVPATPNPTSGFIMLMPKSEVKELSMSVDDALKFIISLGVMQPLTENAFEIKGPN